MSPLYKMFLLLPLTSVMAVRNSCEQGWFDATTFDLGCIQFDFTFNGTWEKANNYCQDKNAQVIELSNVSQLGTESTKITDSYY